MMTSQGRCSRTFASAFLILALTATSALALNPAKKSGKGEKTHDPEQAAQHIIKKNDQNGDGVLEESEFKGKAKRFAHLDKNSDGKLDATELQAAIEARAKHAGKKKKVS
jgi:Ca2+-binding EF-hand superfamily protein